MMFSRFLPGIVVLACLTLIETFSNSDVLWSTLREIATRDSYSGHGHNMSGAAHASSHLEAEEEFQEIASTKRRITMITTLSGELGNNIFHLAHAYALKLEIEELLPSITIELQAEHQNVTKWVKPADDLKRCFPNMHQFQFSSGKWDMAEFGERQSALQSWLKTRQENYTASVLDVDNGMEQSMQVLTQLLEQQESEPSNSLIQEPLNATVSLPYLRVHKMSIGGLVEKHRTRIQQWLAFDTHAQGCCGAMPHPDETIFHFRNFAAESRGMFDRGFIEVGPNHVSPLLLDHLSSSNASSTKVTLITRHYEDNPNAARKHTNAITDSGKLHLRVIPDQSGVQDFCLLLHAKHVVASRMSTFAMTAGLLGNQTSVSLYWIDTKESRKKESCFHPVKWNGDVDPTLQNRFRYKLYPEEYAEGLQKAPATRKAAAAKKPAPKKVPPKKAAANTKSLPRTNIRKQSIGK